VIHTVGPVYSISEDRSALLRAAYSESLRIAVELGAQTVAFPLISSGVYRWPLTDAVTQALAGLRSAPSPVEEVRLVLFGPEAYAEAVRQLG
jgi:O-acetyl-ADP-ribose deacetylase (regulator of RNase III)